MLVKETVTINGKEMTRSFSDTLSKIQSVATGYIYDEAIDIRGDVDYVELSERIDMEGVASYAEAQELATALANAERKINYIGLTDNEALSVAELYPTWESKVNTTIEQGYVTQYGGKLYRARQTHTALAIYPPSLDTAALYEVVDYHHEGTVSDPIPYVPPMEVYSGKYYSEEGVIYFCIRNSGTALTHNLNALVGIYVEPINI